jgi:hypothetical protein
MTCRAFEPALARIIERLDKDSSEKRPAASFDKYEPF